MMLAGGCQLDGFRYRVQDVKRSVTKLCVKEARLAEIKQEVSSIKLAIRLFQRRGKRLTSLRRCVVLWQLMNSETLRTHFESNPQEFQVRHTHRHTTGWLMKKETRQTDTERSRAIHAVQHRPSDCLSAAYPATPDSGVLLLVWWVVCHTDPAARQGHPAVQPHPRAPQARARLPPAQGKQASSRHHPPPPTTDPMYSVALSTDWLTDRR